MKVLVIDGHPREGSFCAAVAATFNDNVLKTGVTSQLVKVRDLFFDPNVHHHSPNQQEIEEDLLHAQEMILWADHLVFVYPTWWGTMPALLKGFIDRVLTNGFAFLEIDGGTGYAPLLRGKSAEIITTMDTPKFIYRVFYRAPGHHAMKDATLGFCGLTVTRVTSFGPVKSSTAAKRDNWLDKTRRRAQSLQSGAITPLRKLSLTVFAWLKAIRFQFYPMTFLAYAAGAMGAQHNGYGFSNATFWLGFLWIFCLELATVFSNEYFDYHTDRHNRYFSPFTGGSRVIVDGLISFKELRTGIFVSLAGAGAFLVLLLQHINFSSLSIIALLVLVVLAIGYTVPPLKLSYRGFGELTVGITHSFAVIFCGYCFQGGNIADSFFWLLGLPLFLSVLPSILLAGIPDRHADLMAAKNTVVVRIGVKGTALLAVLCTWLAIAAVVAFRLLGVLSPFFDGVLYVVVPHAVLLTWLLVKFTKEPTPPKRIDAIIATALGYLVWFILIPLLNLRG